MEHIRKEKRIAETKRNLQEKLSKETKLKRCKQKINDYM